MIIRGAAVVLLGLFTLCDPAFMARAGEGGSASVNYLSPVQAFASYASDKEVPSSGHLVSEHAGGQFAGGFVAGTPTRRTLAGVSYAAKNLLGNGPLFFGFKSSKGIGPAAGGDNLEVYGANFLAPGAGANVVYFGSQPAATVTATNTTLKVIAPPGFDAGGTSVGAVTVSVVNDNGYDRVEGAYIYLPALVAESAAVLGLDFSIRFYGMNKKVVFFAGAFGPPGIASPPIQGKLMLQAPFFQLLPPLPFVGTFNEGNFVLSLPIPPDPSLSGVVAAIQAIALQVSGETPVANGSAFTDVVVFQIAP